MDHLAIDDLDVVAGHGDNASLVGLSLKPGLMTRSAGFGPSTKPITPDETIYLHLSTAPGIDLLAKLDYTLDSIWSLQTDAFGNSQVYTKTVTSGSDTGDSITTFGTSAYPMTALVLSSDNYLRTMAMERTTKLLQRHTGT
jgi:hypothetical protein